MKTDCAASRSPLKATSCGLNVVCKTASEKAKDNGQPERQKPEAAIVAAKKDYTTFSTNPDTRRLY